MEINGMEAIVRNHPLFKGLDEGFVETMAGCAKNAVFKPGSYVFHEGDDADDIYLIREGRVALEIAAPGHGRMVFQTVTTGGVLGLSWLVPPYTWRFDAHVRDAPGNSLRAVVIDATCLREKCERDPVLGYAVMKRFMPALVERLHDTRVQMLDLYRAKD